MVDRSSRLEISNNKWPHRQKFQFYSFLNIFCGICERPLVSPLALLPRLLVTSKLTTRKIFIKDWMTSTHERTLTEQHTEYNNTNTMGRCIPLYLSTHFIFNTLNVIPHSVCFLFQSVEVQFFGASCLHVRIARFWWALFYRTLDLKNNEQLWW